MRTLLCRLGPARLIAAPAGAPSAARGLSAVFSSAVAALLVALDSGNHAAQVLGDAGGGAGLVAVSEVP